MTKTTLRDAQFEDCFEGTRLLARLGLVMPETEEAIRRHWERLWRDNPAFALPGRGPSLGWVLEDDEKMAGFFGNIPMAYHFGEEPLLLADASQWGVDKPYRAEVPRLSDAYFGQPDADLLLVTTAIKPTGRIFERYQAPKVPHPDLDRVLYWIADGPAFLEAALRKKGHPGWQAKLAGATAGLGLSLALAGRRPRGAGDVSPVPLAEVGDAFDELWRAVLKGPRRLRACRDGASIRWHFGPQAETGRFALLAARRGGTLAGYLALVREDAPAIGLRRFKVADLLLRSEDDHATLAGLLGAAFEQTKAGGCHVLELVGLPPALRDAARRFKPLERRMPTWPYYYKARRPDLAEALAAEAAWYPSGYDGDTCLF